MTSLERTLLEELKRMRKIYIEELNRLAEKPLKIDLPQNVKNEFEKLEQKLDSLDMTLKTELERLQKQLNSLQAELDAALSRLPI